MPEKATLEALGSSWPWAATTTAWSSFRLPQSGPVFPGILLSDSNYKRKPGLLTDTHQPEGHRALQWLPILGPWKCHWTWSAVYKPYKDQMQASPYEAKGRRKSCAWATRDTCYTKNLSPSPQAIMPFLKDNLSAKIILPFPNTGSPWPWVPWNNSYYWFSAYYVPATVLNFYAYYLIEFSTPSSETDGHTLKTRNLRHKRLSTLPKFA